MASIPDNYEINISKRTKQYPNGVHWGKLEIPERQKEKAEEKLNFLRELFGNDYHISMTHWECRGLRDDNWD